MVDHPPLHDRVSLGEAGLDVAAGQRPLVHLVGAELLVHERRSFERLLGIGDDLERLVLDDNVLGGVDHGVAVLAEHHRHWIAHVVDGPPRQRPVLRILHLDVGWNPRHRQRASEVGHVIAREHRVDPEPLPGRRRVDRDDLGVRLGRSHECRPHRSFKRDVVDVPGQAHDQPRVLLAAECLPDVVRG